MLAVVHLVYATGHTAPFGVDLMRRDLAERGRELARLLRVLLPDDPDVAGLLALVVLTDARLDARLDDDGELLLMEDQDRSRWNRRAITEGAALVREALRARPPGRFALMAAIAAVHDESPSWSETDWVEILGLYDLLVDVWVSPVVRLNRAIALGFAEGPAEALAELDELAARPPTRALPLPRRGTCRCAAASRAPRRGATRIRGGADPHRQRGGAGVPATTARRHRRPALILRRAADPVVPPPR